MYVYYHIYFDGHWWTKCKIDYEANNKLKFINKCKYNTINFKISDKKSGFACAKY